MVSNISINKLQKPFNYFYFLHNKQKTPVKTGAFRIIIDIINYSGKAAPVGNTEKSNTMNSAVLVG